MAFLYESPFLDLEIYRLLTVLEASAALAQFEGTTEQDQNIVRELRRGFEETEVSRIVVSMAAIIRSAAAANRRAYGVELERPVGVLLPDTARPGAWQALDFWEACNKILHADLVEVQRTAPDTGALTGWLIMNGRKGKKDWEARLDLRVFALTAVLLTP